MNAKAIAEVFVAAPRIWAAGAYAALRRFAKAIRSRMGAMASKRSPSHRVRSRTAAEERLVDRLRKICLALPEANEKLSHGEPTWFAGKGKVFAMLDNHHHGADHLAVWLPQPLGAQEALIDADPERFFRPPYVGPSGWVGVVLDTTPAWEMVASMVRDAYLHVATTKLKARADLGSRGELGARAGSVRRARP